jgi:hypothetical protein
MFKAGANIQAEIAIIHENGLKSVAMNCIKPVNNVWIGGGEHFQNLLQVSDTGYF